MKLFPWVLVLLLGMVIAYGLFLDGSADDAMVDKPVPHSALDEAVPAPPGPAGRPPESRPHYNKPEPMPDAHVPECSWCTEQLERVTRAVVECQARQPAPEACPPRLPTREQCMGLPEVKKMAEELEHLRVWDPTLSECLKRDRRTQARHATLRTALEEDLGLAPEQTQWLAEAACALRELRWMTMGNMHEDGVATAEIWDMVRRERGEMLTEMEAYLGTEPYQRFRKMGGIGLLNDTLVCEDAEQP